MKEIPRRRRRTRKIEKEEGIGETSEKNHDVNESERRKEKK